MIYAAFNNISVISWRSTVLVEKTGENYRPVVNPWQTLFRKVVHWSRFELTTSVVIVTDCIGSCKSNYHTSTATTAPVSYYFHQNDKYINQTN